MRDIVGNPFRRVTIDPRWLTPEVITLAGRIYEGAAFDDLSILADALEAEGCGDGDLLAHCRSESEHVRGCWVVDLILGKA